MAVPCGRSIVTELLANVTMPASSAHSLACDCLAGADALSADAHASGHARRRRHWACLRASFSSQPWPHHNRQNPSPVPHAHSPRSPSAVACTFNVTLRQDSSPLLPSDDDHAFRPSFGHPYPSPCSPVHSRAYPLLPMKYSRSWEDRGTHTRT